MKCVLVCIMYRRPSYLKVHPTNTRWWRSQLTFFWYSTSSIAWRWWQLENSLLSWTTGEIQMNSSVLRITGQCVLPPLVPTCVSVGNTLSLNCFADLGVSRRYRSCKILQSECCKVCTWSFAPLDEAKWLLRLFTVIISSSALHMAKKTLYLHKSWILSLSSGCLSYF